MLDIILLEKSRKGNARTLVQLCSCRAVMLNLQSYCCGTMSASFTPLKLFCTPEAAKIFSGRCTVKVDSAKGQELVRQLHVNRKLELGDRVEPEFTAPLLRVRPPCIALINGRIRIVLCTAILEQADAHPNYRNTGQGERQEIKISESSGNNTGSHVLNLKLIFFGMNVAPRWSR